MRSCIVVLLCALSVTSATAQGLPGEGGAGSGNRLLAFSSATLGFTLKYSSELQLEESADGSVVVCNSRIATGREDVTTCLTSDDESKPVSKMSVSVALRGVETLDELRQWLAIVEPKLDFESTVIGAMQGYKSETITPTGVAIRVYLLSSEKVALKAEVEAYTYARGIELVLPILQTFRAGKEDRDGPQLLDIERNDISVGPGRKPIIRFKAFDDASGLKLKNGVLMTFAPANFSPESPLADIAQKYWTTGTYSELILRDDGWYDVDSLKPEAYRYMPAGSYYLLHFSLEDRAGNIAVYSLKGCGQRKKAVASRHYCRSVNRSTENRSETLTTIPAFVLNYIDEDGADQVPPQILDMKFSSIVIHDDKTLSSQGAFAARLTDSKSGLMPSYPAHIWVINDPGAILLQSVPRDLRSYFSIFATTPHSGIFYGNLVRIQGQAGEQGWYELVFHPDSRFERLYWMGSDLAAFVEISVTDRARNTTVIRENLSRVRRSALRAVDYTPPTIIELKQTDTAGEPLSGITLFTIDQEKGSYVDSWIMFDVRSTQNFSTAHDVSFPLKLQWYETSTEAQFYVSGVSSARPFNGWEDPFGLGLAWDRATSSDVLPPGRYLVREATIWDRAGNQSQAFYPKDVFFTVPKKEDRHEVR